MRYEQEGVVLHTGKHAASVDPRDRLLKDYADPAVIDLTGAPPEKTPGHAILMPSPRLMLGNGPDASVRKGFAGAGDCVWAMLTNWHRLAWAISGQGLFPATGLTAVENYSEFTGYVIGDDSTDRGTDMRTAMTQMVSTGYKDSAGNRHKFGAFLVLDLKNENELKWGLYLSDMGIPLGMKFGNAQMTQFNQVKPWHPVASEPADDGHCVLADYWLRTESWARDQHCWQSMFYGPDALVDEAYFPVDEEGLVNGKSIEGLDTQQLVSDVKAAA